MGRLCDRCAQLLQDFMNFMRRLSSCVVEHFKEFIALLSECCCLNRSARIKQLYEPVLQNHEKQAAQEFLNHMESGLNESPVGNETLEALKILAYSENSDLQHSAALYYLHLSQQLNTQLPSRFLEPYHALLQSIDLEIQQMSSLSLVNFLLEGNVNKELVVKMGLLVPIMELLESGDSAVQCNSCACIMTLALSESNREAIGIAGGILPLLTLAKSYDPRVQQNAVGAILNLTRSERIRSILCREGALPVLTMLLQSADSEIQYYSCASLGNIAVNPEHHKAMLAIGDKLLLRMLFSLMSSSVQKVSSQACLCLNNLASTGEVQDYLLTLDIMPLVLSLLTSSSKDVRKSSITLLCTMSHHPGIMDTVPCEEMLQQLAMLMQMDRANRVVVIHASCTVRNICHAENIEVIVGSQWFEELLITLYDSNNEEESLQYVAACLAELTKHDFAREQLIKRKDEALIRCLVRLAACLEHKELSYQAATVIEHLSHFDPEFSAALSQCRQKEQLEEVRQQTEEDQALLNAAISQTDSLSLNE